MDKTVGVLGGGQIGRMLTEAANRLNIKVVTLDAANAPAKQINASEDHVTGSFRDPTAISLLADLCDVLTIEIEHVDTKILEILSMQDRPAAGRKVDIHPDWTTIRTIQDKYVQKEHLKKHGLATIQFLPLHSNNVEELGKIGDEVGYPFMLKSRKEAYDGRGNCSVGDASQLQASLDALNDRPLYAEKWSHFEAELAVMVVKISSSASDNWKQSTKAFPVVETIHEDSVCKLVYAPARGVSHFIMEQAQDLARRAVSTLKGKGVFGVELFLQMDGSLLINEIAPRPHNSGHYTIEACHLSQYDAHLRAILDLPIPDESLRFIKTGTSAIMLNILGGAGPKSHLRVLEEALSIAGISPHLYGKGDARPGRKMGHVTVMADSMRLAEDRIRPLIRTADDICWLRGAGASDRTLKKKWDHGKPPLVAVTMGSESDRAVLRPGIELLEKLGVPHKVHITSAHRTPEAMFDFARYAAQRGFAVIIAVAGGAAHLPGMIAANTRLPVIGVPVKTAALGGEDSLYSIVQMPRGCPVACVGIDNSVNAAQLAARILANHEPEICHNLEDFLANQTRTVEVQALRMDTRGFDGYDDTDR